MQSGGKDGKDKYEPIEKMIHLQEKQIIGELSL